MGFFSKNSKKIDLEKGKRIFLECKGSIFAIDRDYAEEYWNCNIPRKLEKEWLKEIEANSNLKK